MQDCAAALDCFQSADETDSHSSSSTPNTDQGVSGAAAENEDSKVHVSHNSDVADNAIDTTLAEDHPSPPNNNNADANNTTQQQRLTQRWLPLFLLTLIGMGIATIGVLAGGKVGLFLPKQAILVFVCTVVEYTVAANNDLSSRETGWLSSSALQVDLRDTALKQRGACWLAIGLLAGTSNALWKITIEKKDIGTV
jgi:hypothetical protein